MLLRFSFTCCSLCCTSLAEHLGQARIKAVKQLTVDDYWRNLVYFRSERARLLKGEWYITPYRHANSIHSVITVLVCFLCCQSLGEGLLPYENDRGAHRKFSKTPLKSTRILFRGRGFKFIYTPKRYQFWNNSLVLNDIHDCFQAKNWDWSESYLCNKYSYGFYYLSDWWPWRPLKGTATTLAGVILGFSTLSSTNSQGGVRVNDLWSVILGNKSSLQLMSVSCDCWFPIYFVCFIAQYWPTHHLTWTRRCIDWSPFQICWELALSAHNYLTQGWCKQTRDKCTDYSHDHWRSTIKKLCFLELLLI